jgi:hypothetical protein
MTKEPDTFDPRPGEIVLICKHKLGWKSEGYYIGFTEPVGETREDHGLGNLIRDDKGEQFYVRWVLLCWWCCFVCWVRKLKPVSRARRKVEWVAE